MRGKIFFSILLGIITLAAFIRFYKLDTIPAGFNYDEAMVSYNAYTLSRWHRDESGNLLPLLYIQSSVQYHQAPFFYLTAISQKFFGVTKFALRFTPALFGVITVTLVFLLLKHWLNEKIALAGAFLTAISSWHIFVSRSGYELTIAQTFFLLGLCFFTKNKKTIVSFILSLVFFGLASLTYRSYLIFLPLFITTQLFFLKEKLASFSQPVKTVIFTFVTLFLVGSLLLIINDPRSVSTIFVGKSINNFTAVTSLLQTFVNNYLFHFSFLVYFAPTAFDPKYWMVNRGLLYLFELPLIFLGLIYLVNKKRQLLAVFLPWLFLYPIPHALSELGNANRMFILLPLPQMLAGIGLWRILSMAKKIYYLPIFLVITFSLVHFTFDYLFYYPKTYGHFNHEGPEYVYRFLQQEKTSYGRIIISRWKIHPIFFLFFGKYDLPTYLANFRKYPTLDDTRVFAKIDNVYFVDNIQKVKAQPNDLFIDQKENFPPEINPLKIIYLQNGQNYTYLVSGFNL